MQWVCNVCGYIHDDDEPPDYCFDCGAPGSNFAEWNDDDDDDELIRSSLDEEFDNIDIGDEGAVDDSNSEDGDDDNNNDDEDIRLEDYN